MKAALIIPCRNEEACIADVVQEARLHFQGPIIVVDNGSTDHTAEAAREAGAIVVSEPAAGYGRACMAGVAAAPTDAEAFVFMDGDGSDCPEDIPALLRELEAGADLALGIRRGAKVESGSIAPAARSGNWLSGSLIGLAFGRRIPDLSPLKAIRVDALRSLLVREQTYGWTVELLARAAAGNLRIAEVETGYRKRAAGRSKVSGTVGGSIRAGYRILAVLGRVIISEVSSPRIAAGIGLLAGLCALAAYSGWLLAQAPSSRDVLVSTLLLGWPVLLIAALVAVGTAATVGRLRGMS